MTTTPTPDVSPRGTVELAPSYALPIAFVVLAIPLVIIQPWLALAMSLFGVFLLVQTVTLRLQFTETALDVYRGEQRIRCFPYQDWQNWRIFWPRLPILFYFKEVNSIHFVPVLFNPRQLRSCLEQRCPLSSPPSS